MYELALLAAGGAVTFACMVLLALRRDRIDTAQRGPNQKIHMKETIIAKTTKEHTT
jgi:hypothetical protein